MKICFLAGANSIHSYRWIKYFIERGHDVHWLSLYSLSIDGFHPDAYKNFSYYELTPTLEKPLTPFLPPISSILRIFSVVKWVRGLLKDIQPDLLHAHSMGIYGLIAALSGFHPLVATAWGSDVLVGGTLRIKRPFVKYIINTADLITCDAKHMVEAMVKLKGDRSKIHIINFGIDTKKFQPSVKDVSLIKHLDIANSHTVISVRNFLPVYDIESLIRAIPLVIKELPDTKFIVAGSGSEEANIKQLSASLSVMANIRFTGPIPNTDLPKYLNSADVYVSTSLSDAGIASSTAEAMACALPVVITNSGENDQWISEGEGGFLVPVKNPEAIAGKIMYLLKDEGFRKVAGTVNRKTIMEKNDYYEEMAKMEKIYGKIIEMSGVPLEG